MDKIKIIVVGFFASVVYVCYGVLHPEWFNYHEQYQLFMFGWDYLCEHLAYASGIAVYVSEFLVQFYFFPWLGAILWVGILVLLGVLVWRVAKVLGASECHFPLSFLPSAMITLYCGNQNVMMAFPVSMLFAVSFALLYHRIVNCGRRYILLVLIPLAYWLIGYGVFVYIVLSIMMDGTRYRYYARSFVKIAAVYVVYISLVILFTGYVLMRQYPFIDIICGVNFYQEWLVVPLMQHIVAASIVLVPLLIIFIRSNGRVFSIVEAVVVVAMLPLLMTRTHDKYTYSLLRIDYLVRNQDWSSVVSFCENNPPVDDMGCTGLNLALAMTGQLPDRMFQFPQTGQNGLLSTFSQDMVSCGITAEACYYLGLINTVLRLNYDSQEAILSCKKSGRFTRRIAEAYMLNGNYEMATKYTDMLKKTVFYSVWARKVDFCCKHPGNIAKNSRWANILRRRLPSEQLYSRTDMGGMLMNLYNHSTDNVFALQYSLACDLLNGNLQSFVEKFPITQGGRENDFGYIPRSYQEALAWIVLQKTGSVNKMPAFISNSVQYELQELSRLISTDSYSPEILRGRFAGTYWHYMLMKSVKK